MIILSVCHAGVSTRQVHRTTSSRKGLGFLNVFKFYKDKSIHKVKAI